MTAVLIDAYAYPPRGLNLAAAARYLGLSQGAFTTLVQTGTLPRARQLGSAAVWDRDELDAAFTALRVDAQPAPKPVRIPPDVQGMPGARERLHPSELGTAMEVQCAAHPQYNQAR